MNDDSAAGGGADPVAGLAALLHAVAESADGKQGRHRWDSLTRVVSSQGGTAAGGEAAGVAELAALRQQPDDTRGAEVLARVLLARSRNDESFRGAFSNWRGQKEILATERYLRGSAGSASASSVAQKTSPPENNRPQNRRWRTRLRNVRDRLSGPWLVAIVSGLVVLIIGTPITLFETLHLNPVLPGGNSPSASYSPTSGAPVQINSVHVIPSVASLGMVLPDAVRLSKAQLAQLNRLDQSNWDSYSSLISSEGGVRLGASAVQIAVTGNASQSAQITGVNVVDKSCRPPLTGTLFDTGGGQGEGPTIPANFNLDEPDPVALTPSGQEFFVVHTITLNPGEKQTLIIGSATKRFYCQYKLQLAVLVGSHTTMETVADHGKPFQTLADAPFSRYGAIYVGGYLNTSSIHGAFVPENPATYNGGLVGRHAP